MKRSELTWRDYFAVLIGLAALVGLVVMFNAEGNVVLQNAAAAPEVIHNEFNARVLPAIQKYSLAIGGLLLAASIAYILLGASEDISTTLDEQESKK